ncbi:MAG: hypothetical protein PHW04_13390 [Candidatus Wallbacteria bacterium]|nr:hypothetical protein [Candidatus Wallbacteria bacterium]
MSKIIIAILIALFTISAYAEGFRLGISDSAVTSIMSESCIQYNGTAKDPKITFLQNGTFDYEFTANMLGERAMKISGDIVVNSDGSLTIRFSQFLSNGTQLGPVQMKIAMKQLVSETNRIAQESGAKYQVEQVTASGCKGAVKLVMAASPVQVATLKQAKIIDGYLMLSDSEINGTPKGADIEYTVSETLINKALSAVIPQLSAGNLSALKLVIDPAQVKTEITTKDSKKVKINFAVAVPDQNRLELTASGLDPQADAEQILKNAPDFVNALITLGQNPGSQSAFSLEGLKIVGKLDGLIKLPGKLKAGLTTVQLSQGSLTAGIMIN